MYYKCHCKDRCYPPCVIKNLLLSKCIILAICLLFTTFISSKNRLYGQHSKHTILLILVYACIAQPNSWKNDLKMKQIFLPSSHTTAYFFKLFYIALHWKKMLLTWSGQVFPIYVLFKLSIHANHDFLNRSLRLSKIAAVSPS